MIKRKYKTDLMWRFLLSLATLAGVFWCIGLELPRCVYIINAIQILYALLMLGEHNIKNESKKSSINYFILFTGELLLILSLIVGGYFGSALAVPIIGSILGGLIRLLLILFSIGVIFIFINRNADFHVPLLVNLIGIMGTLVVLKSNLHMLSPTALAAVRQMLCSCLLTYSISVILTTAGKD